MEERIRARINNVRLEFSGHASRSPVDRGIRRALSFDSEYQYFNLAQLLESKNLA